MASVRFDRATRRHPDSWRAAVEDLELEVADGEFLALLGPSGGGKTTALRMLAGLEPVDSGRILLGEADVTRVPARRRDIAMVFQDYALYPHMTVAQNMGFSLRLAGIGRQERARRIREAARLLDMEPHLDRLPSSLSGGQQQRVAMGRALVRNPSAFLMDEPLSSLDAGLRAHMRAEIASLQRRLGTTTLYVTHDQAEAMTMGDRIAVLHEGMLQQLGTPAELYGEPANLMVAGFIGSPAMNLLAVPYREGRVRFGDCEVPVRCGPEFAAPGLTLGVRPEDLRFSGGDEGLEMEVDLVERLGADGYVYGHVDLGESAHPFDRRRRLAVRVDTREHPRPGELVRVLPDPERVHLFDTATGLRIPS